MISAINPMTAGTDALTAFAAPLAQTSAAIGSDASAAGPQPFADLLTVAVGQVNQLQSEAKSAVTGLMTGSGVDVHQAMIATEKASMAFDMALAVRNKAVQAYQSVIGMQF